MTLSDLKPGQKGLVTDLKSTNLALISRVMALGIVPGEEIELLRHAPLGDPLQIKAGATYISVRKVDSGFINITPC